MISLRSGNTEIIGIGGYLPKTIVQTRDIMKEIRHEQYEVSEDFIETSMGICESRHANSNLMPSDLATLAATDLFDHCNISPGEVDMVIFTGIDRDHHEPSTAHRVQKKLGIRESMVFDISNACHGFMDGINVVDSFVSTGAIRYGLVVTGEVPSRVTLSLADELRFGVSMAEFKLKVGALSTGDCGGAVLVGRKRERGIRMTQSCSDGQYADLCYYNKTADGRIDGQLIMGPLSAHAMKMHKKIYTKSMHYLDWNPDDIDYLVTHQVGNRVFSRFSSIFKVPFERMTKTFPRLGNLVTGTVPINLWQLDRNGLLRNSKVFVACSGSGLSISQWGIDF